MWNLYDLRYLGDLLSFYYPIISLFEDEKYPENHILYKNIEYIKDHKDHSKKDLLMFFEKEFTLKKLFFDKFYSNNAMLSIINADLFHTNHLTTIEKKIQTFSPK